MWLFSQAVHRQKAGQGGPFRFLSEATRLSLMQAISRMEPNILHQGKSKSHNYCYVGNRNAKNHTGGFVPSFAINFHPTVASHPSRRSFLILSRAPSFQGTIQNPGEAARYSKKRWLKRVGIPPLEPRWILLGLGCRMLREMDREASAVGFGRDGRLVPGREPGAYESPSNVNPRMPHKVLKADKTGDIGTPPEGITASRHFS